MRYYDLEYNQAQVAFRAKHMGDIANLLQKSYSPHGNYFSPESAFENVLRKPSLNNLFGNAHIFLQNEAGFACITYASGDQWFLAEEANGILLALHAQEYNPSLQKGICDLVFRRIGDHDLEFLDGIVQNFLSTTKFKEIKGRHFPLP